MKRFTLSLMTVLSSAALLCGCGSSPEASTTSADATVVTEESTSDTSVATLNIAYQYGLAYAPAVIAQEKGFIEESYKEATGKDVKIEWTQMNSGADINTGIASGTLDVGFMGIGPAVSGVAKDVGYKIFTNLSGQQHGMMSNTDEVTSLADLIGSDKQIALVNIGSIQHIILAKALADNGYDAHALDSNIVAMKHPDGMSALISGSVACHLTSSPYIFKEEEDSSLHEITEVKNAWTSENSFIVGVASNELYNNNPELYNALCSGINKGMDFINNNTEEAAKITCVYDGNDEAVELDYMKRGKYTSETKGLYELATFMSDNAFVEKSFSSYNDLVFDNVKGD